MFINFTNKTSCKITISFNQQLETLKSGESKCINIGEKGVLKFSPNLKDKTKLPFLSLWMGTLISEEVFSFVTCDAYLDPAYLKGIYDVEIRHSLVRSNQVAFQSVEFNNILLSTAAKYKISNPRKTINKSRFILLLTSELILALIGFIHLIFDFDMELFGLLLLLIGTITIPELKSNRKMKKICTDENADRLLHLSFEEKLDSLLG